MITKQRGYIFQCNENISEHLNTFIFDFGEVQFNLDNLIKREIPITIPIIKKIKIINAEEQSSQLFVKIPSLKL